MLAERDAIRAFEIVAGSDAREYQVIVMSGSEIYGRQTPLRTRIWASGSGADAVSAVRPTPPAVRPVRPGPDPEWIDGPRPDRRRHLEFMKQIQEEVRRIGAKPAVEFGAGDRARIAAASNVPRVGDTLTLNSPVQGTGVSCLARTNVPSTVRAVGEHFVIVEDNRVEGYFTQADYDELDRELDAFVAPATLDYFGSPRDLDGNERSIAFFTWEVNRITPPGSSSFVIGFHSSTDHFSKTGENACPASNEAELIYLIAPDPDGQSGGTSISTERVKKFSRGLVAHEFQHLINASLRLHGQAGQDTISLADLWINEGLSHVAEEIAGFYRLGVGVRQDYGYTELASSAAGVEIFEDFHEGNLRSSAQYLEDPTGLNSLAISNADLNFATRGWGYQFLRWLGDQYGPEGPGTVVLGSNEPELFREVVTGGPDFLFGPRNIERSINAVAGESLEWADILAKYFAAPAADGADVDGLESSAQFRTWDVPRLWDELSSAGISRLSGGYPLRRRPVGMGAGVSLTTPFDLGSSTAQYFRLTSDGAHPRMIVETTVASGGNVPNGAGVRIVVVRTK